MCDGIYTSYSIVAVTDAIHLRCAFVIVGHQTVLVNAVIDGSTLSFLLIVVILRHELGGHLLNQTGDRKTQYDTLGVDARTFIASASLE